MTERQRNIERKQIEAERQRDNMTERQKDRDPRRENI